MRDICDNRQFLSNDICDYLYSNVCGMRKNANMSDTRQELRDWLGDQLTKMGHGSKKKLAEALGISSEAVSRILNSKPGKEARDVKAHELLKMSEFFGIPAPGLETTQLQAPEFENELKLSNDKMVETYVAGTVEAGSFREVDELDQSEPEIIAVPADRQFPRARLLVFNVAGDSMNDLKPRPILDGDRAICLAYEDVAHSVPLRDGMVVVVQRTRDGGHTREWSVKQIEIYDDRIEFHPRSKNARYKPIIVKKDAHADDGVEVEIIGLMRRIMNDFPLF